MSAFTFQPHQYSLGSKDPHFFSCLSLCICCSPPFSTWILPCLQDRKPFDLVQLPGAVTHSLLVFPALSWLSSLYILGSGSGLRRNSWRQHKAGMLCPLMERTWGYSGNPEKGLPEPGWRGRGSSRSSCEDRTMGATTFLRGNACGIKQGWSWRSWTGCQIIARTRRSFQSGVWVPSQMCSQRLKIFEVPVHQIQRAMHEVKTPVKSLHTWLSATQMRVVFMVNL